MEQCLKLLQQIIERILRTLEVLILALKKKQFNNNDLQNFEKYQGEVNKFADYINNIYF